MHAENNDAGIKIKWLGQAGYSLDIDGMILCIDPYLSDIVFEAEHMPRMIPPPVSPEELQCHLYLSTHDHLDHLDPVTVSRMNKEHVVFIGPQSCMTHFRRLGIAEKQLCLLERGQTVRINGITLRGVFADHTEDSIGVALMYKEMCLYFVGDSLYHEKLGEELERADVLFTCINGKLGNMTDMEAVRLVAKLKPRLAIPNHFGMFAANTADPGRFVRKVKKLGVLSFIPKVGEEFVLEVSSCVN